MARTSSTTPTSVPAITAAAQQGANPAASDDDDASEVGIVPASAAGPVGVFKASTANAAALLDGFEVAPRFIKLEEDDGIRGVFVRWGSVQGKDQLDRLTGEFRPGQKMKTLVLRPTDDLGRPADYMVEFLSAHEIDRAYAKLGTADEGRMELTVIRGRDKRKGQNVVTDYICASRRWARAAPTNGGER